MEKRIALLQPEAEYYREKYLGHKYLQANRKRHAAEHEEKAREYARQWAKEALEEIRRRYGAPETMSIPDAEACRNALNLPLTLSPDALRERFKKQGWPDSQVREIVKFVEDAGDALALHGRDYSVEWEPFAREIEKRLAGAGERLRALSAEYANALAEIGAGLDREDRAMSGLMNAWRNDREQRRATATTRDAALQALKKHEQSYAVALKALHAAEAVRREIETLSPSAAGNAPFDGKTAREAVSRAEKGRLRAVMEQSLVDMDFRQIETFSDVTQLAEIREKDIEPLIERMQAQCMELRGLLGAFEKKNDLAPGDLFMAEMRERLGDATGRVWAQEIWRLAHAGDFWAAYTAAAARMADIPRHDAREQPALKRRVLEAFSCFVPPALDFFNEAAGRLRSRDYYATALVFQRMNDEIASYYERFVPAPGEDINQKLKTSQIRRDSDRERVLQQIGLNLVIEKFNGAMGEQIGAAVARELNERREKERMLCMRVFSHLDAGESPRDSYALRGDVVQLAVETLSPRVSEIGVDVVDWNLEQDAVNPWKRGGEPVPRVNRLLRQTVVREHGKTASIDVTMFSTLGGGPEATTVFKNRYGVGGDDLPGCVMLTQDTEISYSHADPRYTPYPEDSALAAHTRDARFVDTSLARQERMSLDREIVAAMAARAAAHIADKIWPHIVNYPAAKFLDAAAKAQQSAAAADYYGRCFEYVLNSAPAGDETTDWFKTRAGIEERVATTPEWKSLAGLWDKCVESALQCLE